MTSSGLSSFQALENARHLDARGYVCTPATTKETVVSERARTKCGVSSSLDGPGRQRTNSLQRVTKPAKVAIGKWGDAEGGLRATTERFQKQGQRVLQAAREYALDQGLENLGVAIHTAKSGIAVIDIDSGKVSDPARPGCMLPFDLAHDKLLLDVLRLAGAAQGDGADWLVRLAGQIHVRTPSGGWHYYFRQVPGQKARTHTGIVPNVDIRAGFSNQFGWESSGLVYAPGNITPRGAYVAYRGTTRLDLKDFPAVEELPALPDELHALLQRSTNEIRRTAVELGIAFAGGRQRCGGSLNSRVATTLRGPMPTAQDSGKWRRIALDFVRGGTLSLGDRA